MTIGNMEERRLALMQPPLALMAIKYSTDISSSMKIPIQVNMLILTLHRIHSIGLILIHNLEVKISNTQWCSTLAKEDLKTRGLIATSISQALIR